ncbi:YhdP family protein [Shewanella sp. SR44-3]|uniref:YhdP family protein n=1 Tax=Shewanella sp. SR44-3 TaxID=2760936 RepID=UPI0015FD5458|nr:YhdP family protein [Shewanella sp. SR44-3]MBB1269658.1 TIGR02099 family protein [Shewanella sp. SR44-3]
MSASAPQKLIKLAWQLLALGLLLFALLVSLIRSLLPHVPEVRQQLVEYLQHEYKVQVQLDSITAQWRAFGPELNINQLVIPPQDSLPITLMVDKVRLKVDFWDSLASLSPQIETVTFDGLHLAYDLSHQARRDGNNSPEPENSSEPENSPKSETATTQDWLYSFALEQLSHFSITNASVQLLSDKRRFKPIFINNLVWLNTPNLHRGEGQLLMDKSGTSPQSVSLKLEIKGDGYQPDTLVGQAYLQANELDLGQWLNGKAPELDFKRLLQAAANLDSTVQHAQVDGELNFEAWLELKHRSVSSGLLAFKPSTLQWQLGDVTEQLALNSGQFELVSNVDGWQVSSHQLELMSNQQAWPELDIGIKYQNDVLFGYLNELSLPLLTPLLALVPDISKAQLTQWQMLELSGKLGPLRVFHSPETGLVANTKLMDIEWQQAGALPGSRAIDAKLSYGNQGLDLELPSQQYRFDFGSGFEAPLTFNANSITARFELNEQRLDIPSVELSNKDLSLAAAVSLSLKPDAHLSLAANINIKQAEALGDYFPLQAMSPDLVDYLNGAIIKGQVPDANIVWHGALGAYPYDDKSGVFQAGFTLENAVYRFEPDWPEINDLRLNALFENAAMDLWVEKGQLQDVAIDGAYVGIPVLGDNSLLRVEAELATQALAATQVLQASPLKDTVGETLNSLQVRGPIKAKLDLSIPLYDGESERITGDINFSNNSLFLAGPELEFSNLSGDVSFINQALLGKGLTAKLLEQNIEFSFATEERDQHLALALDLQGKVVIASLPQTAVAPLSDYFQGAFDWDGAMTMVFEPNNYQLQLQLNSDLVGTEMSLPAPFNKAAAAPLGLGLELLGDNQSTSVSGKLANIAEFWGEITPDSGNSLSHYDVMLGRVFKLGDTLNKHQGQIQLGLDKAQLMPWLAVIEQLTQINKEPNLNELKANFFPPLLQVSGKINQFELPGLPLTNAAFNATSLTDKWLFKVDSEQFIGDISLYPDWKQQGLAVEGKKLALMTIPSKLIKADASSILVLPPTAEHTVTPEKALTDEAAVSVGSKSAPALALTPEIETPLAAIDEIINVADLPKLKIDIAEFSVDAMPLGRLQLDAAHSEKGYQFNRIDVTKAGLNFNATGLWSHGFDEVDGSGDEAQQRSEFELSLAADKFDIVSQTLSIEPGIKDSAVKLTGRLAWPAAPHQFSLAQLDGKLKFELEKGHLSEISDKGARIFSLFSLDSLLRKLSFDFSDVFGQGLYFNEFKGDINIDNGVLKTRNTEMDAIAGNIKVRGYTDLSSQSLNYDIRFVPQLASSVPTVVLLSTSAWTFGVGALALTKVLEPMIEIISEMRFRVTGTMNEPIIEELERKHKEIEIPEAILKPTATEVPQSQNPIDPVAESAVAAPKTK